MAALPGTPLIPAAIFVGLYLKRRTRISKSSRVLAIIVTLVWTIYGIYETGMYFWMKTVIAPIRVDLLLIVPVLYLVTLIGIVALLLINSNIFASDKFISVTVKSSQGISGSISFNFHPNQHITVLVYESASSIKEIPVSIDAKTVSQIRKLTQRVLDEFIRQEDFSPLPEYKQTTAIIITQSKVTKSISTRRYSKNMISLIKMINNYAPAGYEPRLDRK